MRKVNGNRQRLLAVANAYGGPRGLAARVPNGNPRMVSFWLADEKRPTPPRAECVNALARAKALPKPFTIVEILPKPRHPGDRAHRTRTFRNRDLGRVVRAFGDIFLFAEAAAISVQTVYRWASLSHEPRPHLAARVNALARAKGLRAPFVVRGTRFRGRGPVSELVRAYEGVVAFSVAARVSQTSVRTWARGGAIPWPPVVARVNAMARKVNLAEPFPAPRPVLPAPSRSAG